MLTRSKLRRWSAILYSSASACKSRTIALTYESYSSLLAGLELTPIGYYWQTPTAPEARGILAGGRAKRRHRKRHDRTSRPERAPDRHWSYCEFWSGVPAGTRTIFFNLSRWLRFAPPPVNFRRPSGAHNDFTEFASSIQSDPTPERELLSLSAKGLFSSFLISNCLAST